ncbi:3-oxoacyl-[acyl-carrier-protein] reductase FabG-like [Salvia splendens]|nr:3-oxoacyl-[acyl-carrier-protein] reductase FabG-like [Salvia splendens]
MGNSPSPRGIAAIVGRSVAGKFAHEGYTVAILARDLRKLSRLANEIVREEKPQVFAIRINFSETHSVKEAFKGVLSLRFVEVLVYNAYNPASSWAPPPSLTSASIISRSRLLSPLLAHSTASSR